MKLQKTLSLNEDELGLIEDVYELTQKIMVELSDTDEDIQFDCMGDLKAISRNISRIARRLNESID